MIGEKCYEKVKRYRCTACYIFIIAISIPTFMLAIDVVVTTKSTQRSNMQLTSEQTLQETKKGFETYLKTLSQPIDLLTRKMKLSILKIRELLMIM